MRGGITDGEFEKKKKNQVIRKKFELLYMFQHHKKHGY